MSVEKLDHLDKQGLKDQGDLEERQDHQVALVALAPQDQLVREVSPAQVDLQDPRVKLESLVLLENRGHQDLQDLGDQLVQQDQEVNQGHQDQEDQLDQGESQALMDSLVGLVNFDECR